MRLSVKLNLEEPKKWDSVKLNLDDPKKWEIFICRRSCPAH